MERQQLTADMTALRRTIAWMGELVLERLSLAARALVERDAELAHLVIKRDSEIDDLQMQVDQRAMLLLALQNPEAGDLRFVLAAIKANADLERLGDLAVNIAESAVRTMHETPLPQLNLVDTMSQRALGMVRDALTAFIDRDAAVAREVLRQDDEVDAMKGQVQRLVMEQMAADPATIERGIELVIVSRNVERIADHATNMAEDAIFLVEARDVRHHHGMGGTPPNEPDPAAQS